MSSLRTIRTALVNPPPRVNWVAVTCALVSWGALVGAFVLVLLAGSVSSVALILFTVGVGMAAGPVYGVIATMWTRHPFHEEAIRFADALLDEEEAKKRAQS